NGGAWDRAGIASSAAASNALHSTTLGVLSGAEFSSVGGDGTFDGLSYAPTHTLVKDTYYGDSDLNGQVNFDDYARIDSGFNNGRSGWLNGDFDGNGVVNFDDYSLIDLAFNVQSQQPLLHAVPEPTTAAASAISFAALVSARRRHRRRRDLSEMYA